MKDRLPKLARGLNLRDYKTQSSVINYCEQLSLKTLRPRQNGSRFSDDTFKRIFLNENVTIFIKIYLKYVRKGPIDNIPALVQIMAWRRLGDKALSETTMVSLLKHICVTRPQWINQMPRIWPASCIAYFNMVPFILSSSFANCF